MSLYFNSQIKWLGIFMVLASNLSISASAAGLFQLAPEEHAIRALENKDPSTLDKLLKNGLDSNTENKEGQKLLHVAVHSGDLRLAKLMIKSGAKVDGLNKLKETPLMIAAIDGHLEMAKLLIQNEAQISPPTDWTPLCYAAAGGSIKILELLIQNGADLDKRCVNDISPLMMAIRQNQSEAAVYLLNQGASATDQSINGKTVWQWAKEHRQKAVLDKLKALHLNEED